MLVLLPPSAPVWFPALAPAPGPARARPSRARCACFPGAPPARPPHRSRPRDTPPRSTARGAARDSRTHPPAPTPRRSPRRAPRRDRPAPGTSAPPAAPGGSAEKRCRVYVITAAPPRQHALNKARRKGIFLFSGFGGGNAVFRGGASFPLRRASFSVEFYITPRYNIVSGGIDMPGVHSIRRIKIWRKKNFRRNPGGCWS